MFWKILRTPGVARVLASTVVARLPNGAIGLVLLLRTREMTGSYAAGGAVSAAFSIFYGIGSPALGRLIDRRGQTAVVVPASILCGAALAAFAALGDGTPLALVMAVAAAAGATTPPLPAAQRAIWNRVLRGPLRHGAYALDSVVFEIVYICGPLVLVTGIGAWSLRAAAFACAASTAVGSLAFAAAPLSRAMGPAAEVAEHWLGALRAAGVRTLLAALALFGLAVAAIEVAAAAFCTGHGHPHAVGVLLALWGVGSMIGGIVLGRVGAPANPPRRLAALTVALAVANLPLLAAGSVSVLGVLLVVAGGFIAPSLATAFALLSEVAPAGTVTEAQGWIGSSFGGGIALGAALAGKLVDVSGTTAALAVAVVALLLSAAVVVAGRPRLAVTSSSSAAAPAA